MKAYSNPISVTNQFAFCGLPLRLDTYAGCAFRCSYCFARYRGGYSYPDEIRPANPERIETAFSRALTSDKAPSGVVGQFLRRRTPVHFGGMSDPFQPAEKHYRVTEAVLRILAKWSYPTVISTKGALIGDPVYMRHLQQIRFVVVQFSFSTTRDEIAKRVEPHSTPPSLLLRVMEKLSMLGVTVTCRWQPYIPGVSETPEEFVPRIASTGAHHLGIEHLKVPMERNRPLWNVLVNGVGKDLHREYLRLGSQRIAREYVLPPEQKLPTILQVAGLVRKNGMTFGSADNEFQYLSDTACCCSGVDQFPGFENWFKHQIGYAVRLCRGKTIRYEAISKQWSPTGSIERYLNSHCRRSTGERGASMKHYVRTKWDNPLAADGPASFFGVIPTGHVTRSGRRTYEWDPDVDLGPLVP